MTLFYNTILITFFAGSFLISLNARAAGTQSDCQLATKKANIINTALQSTYKNFPEDDKTALLSITSAISQANQQNNQQKCMSLLADLSVKYSKAMLKNSDKIATN